MNLAQISVFWELKFTLKKLAEKMFTGGKGK